MQREVKFNNNKIDVIESTTTTLNKDDVVKRLENIRREKEHIITQNKQLIGRYNQVTEEEVTLNNYLLQFPVGILEVIK